MRGTIRRWPRAARVTAALALLCGATAFGLVHAYVSRVEAAHPALGTPVPVLVAVRDLPRGTTLTSADLESRPVPVEFAPPGAVRDGSAAAGRVLLAALAAGEALTHTRLAAARAGPVAALVPPGLRAFAVTADVPPGAVRSGDRVDVLATIGGDRPHTETVATGLEVLSVLGGGRTDALSGAPSDAPAIVVLVTPDDAERLAYAGAFGELAVAIAGAEGEVVTAAPPSASPGG